MGNPRRSGRGTGADGRPNSQLLQETNPNITQETVEPEPTRLFPPLTIDEQHLQSQPGERPLATQPPMKITAVYDVNISELPIRVLADCLRGSPALHSALPHTPVVRANAALAMAQWQNNKGPKTRDSINPDGWVGLNLLLQYFKERFYSNSVIMPIKFTKEVSTQLFKYVKAIDIKFNGMRFHH